MKAKTYMISSLAFFALGAASMHQAPRVWAQSIQPEIVSVLPEQKLEQHQVKVIRVIDGDTFIFDAPWDPFGLEWKIRIRGIDTPEKGYLAKCEREKELAARAKALAEEQITQSGGLVILTSVKHDKYGGRYDADVRLLDGTSLADSLLTARLAKLYNGGGPRPNWCR